MVVDPLEGGPDEVVDGFLDIVHRQIAHLCITGAVLSIDEMQDSSEEVSTVRIHPLAVLHQACLPKLVVVGFFSLGLRRYRLWWLVNRSDAKILIGTASRDQDAVWIAFRRGQILENAIEHRVVDNGEVCETVPGNVTGNGVSPSRLPRSPQLRRLGRQGSDWTGLGGGVFHVLLRNRLAEKVKVWVRIGHVARPCMYELQRYLLHLLPMCGGRMGRNRHCGQISVCTVDYECRILSTIMRMNFGS